MTITISKPVLVVLTNASNLPQSGGHMEGGPMDPNDASRRTGFDIREVAYIWITLHKKMNAKIVFATPRGGEAPVDPRSMKEAEQDDQVKEFVRDRALLDNFKNTTSLDSIRAEEFQWILFPGCHGAMVDLPNSTKLTEILCSFYEKRGNVAAIGHGVAALLNLKTKNGEYYLKGKRITAFTNEEEREKGFDKLVPYLLEDKLKERGAKFEKTKPFESHVVQDERLITGQNCTSIQEWIKKIMETSA